VKSITWVVAVSITLAGTGCGGRRVATSFSEMEKRAPAGTTVYVTTNDGKEVKGKLAAVSGSSMRVSMRDTATRDFSEADVARVAAKDTLWNGMLIGAGVAGAAAFMLNDESCVEPYAQSNCRKVSRGAGVAITAGIGAALGTAFDALHHRPVFRAARSGRGASLIVAPLVTPNVAAIRISSRF
jgi:hypothetical protein